MAGRERAAKRTAMVLAGLVLLAGCGDAGTVPPTAETGGGARPAAGELPEPPRGPVVPVLALGDSLFAGYGLERGEAYPAQLEAALRARGINAEIINAGVSGDTSAAGRQRLEFVLSGLDREPALALVELGANDMLRGLPPAELRANLDAILTELDRRGIETVLMGMRAAPNLGPDYAREFDAIYPALAEKHAAALVPLFVAPLVEDRSLLQADRLHPTVEGVSAMVAASVDTIADAMPAAAQGAAD